MGSSVKYIRTALVLVIVLAVAHIGTLFVEALMAPRKIEIRAAVVKRLNTHEHDTARGDSLLSEGHTANVESPVLTVDRDTWVTGVELIVEGAPQAVVHHIHLYVEQSHDEYCPQLPEVISDMGQDAVPIGHFPEPYALFLPEGTKLKVSATLHNPEPPLGTGKEYENVVVGFKLRTDPFALFKSRKNVSFHVLSLADTDRCGASSFSVPPHSVHYKTYSGKIPGGKASTLTFTKSGTIIGLGAHLHAWEGGEKLEVFLNGMPLTTFIPQKTSTNPDVWQSIPYVREIPVKPGDRITISATYSNPYDNPEDGAMGMLGVYIHYDQN